MATNYANLDQQNTPYGSGAPFYSESQGYITPAPMPTKKGLSPWIKFGVPLAVLIIAGGVVGGILGTRHSDDKGSTSSTSAADSTAPPADPSAAASSAVADKKNIGVYATGTNSLYMMPIYPSTTNAQLFIAPTFVPTKDAKAAWPADPQSFASPSPTKVRKDRPRIIAPAYKWDALKTLIPNDPYLTNWDKTIQGNATDYYKAQPVKYYMDGGSGILDNAREVKQRIKAFGYMYRMTKDTKWPDRAWTELENAANFGQEPDRWNSGHFLDVAELSSAFGIAYDWMYEAWTDDKKASIRGTLIKYGLQPGVNQHETPAGWWKNTGIYGNWNCVCNSGLTIGALAILGDDDSGIAEKLLGLTVPNAQTNCAFAPTSDGTWTESPNYWYFGTTGHAEMTSALMSATGSDYGLLRANPNFWLTGLYHMYSAGPTSQFDWGDHGPNKFSTTANAMFLYGKEYNQPAFTLFQRDQHDSADPWTMFWYDPTVAGAFWQGLSLDHLFANETDIWAAMRSSWTDNNALYAAMKTPQILNHQTHGDLDVGDFVVDALGYRWAGEFGSGNYLSQDYFKEETQTADRWLYYRKRTEGQNCIVVGKANQLVTAQPKLINFGTTNETQGPTTVYTPPKTSTAFFVADVSSAYDKVTSYNRGIRVLNGRKQVLVQDDITASDEVMWIMHTNATVTINGSSADLQINDQHMTMTILNAPNGAVFTKGDSVRFQDDPSVPSANSQQQQLENNDQENPGVTQLMITLPAGTYSIQVLFNPQWSGMAAGDFKTPPSVSLDKWTLTSHDN